ncbi:MAG: hypothetical protein JSS81_26650 [Acidobacteria bacterium]|nr:hypothetical protein [Acidobacteriota bacterium]
MFDAVAEILFRHDPTGLDFGFNADEYEPEAETILPRLRDCRSADDVERIVREELRRWFDEETAAGPRIGEIAGEIWGIYETRRKNDG